MVCVCVCVYSVHNSKLTAAGFGSSGQAKCPFPQSHALGSCPPPFLLLLLPPPPLLPARLHAIGFRHMVWTPSLRAPFFSLSGGCLQSHVDSGTFFLLSICSQQWRGQGDRCFVCRRGVNKTLVSFLGDLRNTGLE